MNVLESHDADIPADVMADAVLVAERVAAGQEKIRQDEQDSQQNPILSILSKKAVRSPEVRGETK
jgi:hypothetical protein